MEGRGQRYGWTDVQIPQAVFYRTLPSLVPSKKGKDSSLKKNQWLNLNFFFPFWAVALEGTGGDKVLKNTGGICMSVCLYVLSPPLGQLGGWLRLPRSHPWLLRGHPWLLNRDVEVVDFSPASASALLLNCSYFTSS